MDLSADQIIIVIAVLALSISVHESMHSFLLPTRLETALRTTWVDSASTL
jgi:hypothetical protein